MPLHEWECPRCGVFEELVDRPAPEAIKCECGRMSKRLMSAGHVIADMPAWVESSAKALGEDRIYTRTELKQAMQRRGVVDWETGKRMASDARDRKDTFKKQVHKNAVDRLMKKAALEVR